MKNNMEQEQYPQNQANNRVSQEEMIRIIRGAIELKQKRDLAESKLEKKVGTDSLRKGAEVINENSRIIDKEAMYRAADDLNLSREDVDKALYKLRAAEVSNVKVLAESVGCIASGVGAIIGSVLFIPTTTRMLEGLAIPYLSVLSIFAIPPIMTLDSKSLLYGGGALALTNLGSGFYEVFRHLKKKEIEKME